MSEYINRNESLEQDIIERLVKKLGQEIAKYKWVLLLSLVVGGVLGYAYSYTKPKLYTSSAQLLPEFKSGSASSGLASLSSLAGLDISGKAGDAFRPELFPNILQSTSAMIYLLKQPVETSDNQKYPSMIKYLEAVYKRPFKLSALVKDNKDQKVWQFTPDEMNLIGTVRGPLSANFDRKSSITQISFEMSDPMVASISTANLIDYLRTYLTDYLGTKKDEQVEFLNTRVQEAKKRRESAEFTLKSYQDSNKNIVVQTALIREQKLQENLSQAQALYLDLYRQLERSKLDKMQEEPLFMVLENPIVPINNSSPRRLYYGLAGSFGMLVVCCILLLVRRRFV